MKNIKILSIGLMVILLLTCFKGCAEIGIGAIKEIYDYREEIGEELSELRDAFKEEPGELFGAVGRYKLTKDENLIGARTFKNDKYRRFFILVIAYNQICEADFLHCTLYT